MEIVKMKKTDAAELAALDEACFAVPWSEKSFADEAENALAKYFVAMDDGKIVGYGGIWLVADEGQITNIAVLPTARRCGVASQILDKLLEEAGNMPVVLEVRKSNDAAISLYEKYGFSKVGERKNFYHSPVENAIIMMRGET